MASSQVPEIRRAKRGPLTTEPECSCKKARTAPASATTGLLQLPTELLGMILDELLCGLPIITTKVARSNKPHLDETAQITCGQSCTLVVFCG